MYVKVKVTPGARRENVSKVSETEFQISVKEKAERNLANTRVREILALEFKVSLQAVKIVTGHRSSTKMLSIDEEITS